MKYRQIIFLLTLIPSISSCYEDSDMDGRYQELEIRTLSDEADRNSGVSTLKQSKVMTNQYDFDTELAKYTDMEPEIIDFSIGKVLLVDMGERPNGGYGIAVSSAQEFRNYVLATVNYGTTTCGSTQAVTNPYQFVFIPTQKEILIKERLRITHCNDF